MYLVTQPELEAALIERQKRADFPAIRAKHAELLEKLSNVEGDEVLALALIAMEQAQI